MRQLKITKKITDRESASLEKYLQDICKIPLITVEEEVALAKKIRTGDKEALNELTRANLRFVVSVAKQYQNQGLPLPDLINEGNLGLIKAAERFDESRGFKFISYAVWRIRQSILQAIAEHSRIIRLPLNVVGNVNKINKAFGKFEQDYGYEPTNEQLAEVLEMSVKMIKKANEHSWKTLYLDRPLDTEDSGGGNLLDTIESREFNEPDYNLHQDSLRKEIARALNTLNPREKGILQYFYGLHPDYPQGLTLEEIGVMFELTRERVRQIKEKAIRRLRHTSRSKQLKQYLGK